MKKIIMTIILTTILLVLSSCTIVEGDISERIASPQNNTPPILGKWEIVEVEKKAYSNLSNGDPELLIGREGLFHKEGVVIGDDYTTKPSFKIKNVNASDYLLYKYKTSPLMLGIETETVEVINIFNDNAYFYELIKVDDDTMLIHIDESFFKFERIVDEVSKDEIMRYINVEKSVLRTLGTTEEVDIRTGVLLGIKVPSFDETNQVPVWSYKTIWINSQNRVLNGIYELDDLLMPRKNGFWIIDSERIAADESISDEITAIPQFRVDAKESIIDDSSEYFARNSYEVLYGLETKNEMIALYDNVQKTKTPSIIKNILFIGNDYISIENIDLDRNSRQTLQVYAIDNLDEKKPIKLTDLIGANGSEIFTDGARSVLSLDSDIVINEENVGLARRNGYWIMKGRINYRQNEEELFKDFNIKAIPPKEMVSYDEQTIPWDAVRLNIPDLVDVFSSPNNEYIVVVTGTHIIIYYLEDGILVNKPVAKIKLPYDATVIMSEWAVGRYSNIWENEVINSGGRKLEY